MKSLIVVLIIILLWGCSTDKTVTTGPHIGPRDTIPPRVISITPVDGDTTFPSNAQVRVVFSEDIDLMTLDSSTFWLDHGASGIFYYDNRTVYFSARPVSLISNTTYAATVETGITDLAGNHLAAPYHWSFKTTTPDLTPFTVVSTYPTNGDSFVPANAVMSATFSKAIDLSSVGDSTFYLKAGVQGTVSVVGNTISFTPSRTLMPYSSYTAVVSGAIADIIGNQLGQPHTWSFMTLPADTIAPWVVATFPTDGATNVSPDSAIRIVFSEPVDLRSISDSVVTVGDNVTGHFSVAGNSLLFLSTAPLLTSHFYTVRLSTTLTDLAGNHLEHPFTFSFTTEKIVIMPLAVGNFWEYHVFWQDTLNSGNYYDTTKIVRDTLIDGEEWYVDQKGYLYANRSDGLYLLKNGQPVLAIKFPTIVNDSFPSPFAIPSPYQADPIRHLVVQSVSQSITVPTGTFTCIVYRTPDDPAFPAGYADYRYCPNVGLVQYFKDPSYAFNRFSDPRVNKVLTKVDIRGTGK